ncbi:MAG: efflux RND transporter permease subunit, partial [Acidobacteriota bacterium]
LEPLRLGRTAIEGVDPDIHFAASAGPPERFAVRIARGAAGSPSEERIVPLGALAEVSARPRASPRERRGGRPATRLAIAGATGDAERLESTLKSLPLAEDSTVQLAGQTRELRRSFSQLQLSFALALLLIFLTVAALYESLTLPLVVMTTVPVASAGAFLGLLAAGESLNVMSLLGLILLAGIVVNNAIVLLHRAEQRRRGGESAREAIRQAAAERYRPILMTTLTTLLGMIPLALLGGEGLELRRALAVSVAGGLVSSWLAALLVVPRLYVVATALRAGDPPRLRDRRRAAA